MCVFPQSSRTEQGQVEVTAGLRAFAAIQRTNIVMMVIYFVAQGEIKYHRHRHSHRYTVSLAILKWREEYHSITSSEGEVLLLRAIGAAY